MPENNPCNPTKAIAIIAAQIRAIGKPLNAFGVFAVSNLTLIQENVTMINKKPIEVPNAFASDARNVRPWSVFDWATPKTAQLVVISGK